MTIKELKQKSNGFLNKNFKPIMKWHYKRKYKKEIFKMLSLFYEYRNADGIDMMQAIKIMTLDKDNWSLEKSTTILGVCVYCGFLDQN